MVSQKMLEKMRGGSISQHLITAHPIKTTVGTGEREREEGGEEEEIPIPKHYLSHQLNLSDGTNVLIRDRWKFKVPNHFPHGLLVANSPQLTHMLRSQIVGPKSLRLSQHHVL